MATKRAASRDSVRVPWTREQLLLALNLYYRIPFGKQHKGAPEVVALANAIGRTPSAVAMKLNNFTAIDPAERGRVKGLESASALDRQIWDEFHAAAVPMAAESEALWVAHVGDGTDAGDDRTEAIFTGPTDAQRMTTVRRAQGFFSRTVRSAYEWRCCVTGIDVREFLVASHIVPWAASEAGRVDPTNGLCLSRLHDAAFDRALVTFDEDLRLLVGRRLRDHFTNEAVRAHFEPYAGQRLRSPVRFAPAPGYLEQHRQRFARAER